MGCTCAKPGEVDLNCVAHGRNPSVCSECLGSGQTWHMQGGPHGIGRRGRCHRCGGTGQPVPVEGEGKK
jgi:DnaJ-class molecular chaperone